MIQLQWRALPPKLTLPWRVGTTTIVPQDPPPPTLAVLIGPPGPPGPPGDDAAHAVDPGDLTLIFDNKLI